jgi:hypothetical protein
MFLILFPHYLSFFAAAYFSQASVDQLFTVDEVPRICDLDILEEVFKCTRSVVKNLRLRKNVSKTITSYRSSRTQPKFEESGTYTTPHPPLSPQDDTNGHDSGAKGSQPFPPHQPSTGLSLNATTSFDHSDLLPPANGYHPYSSSPQYLPDLGASPSSHLSSAFGYDYPMPLKSESGYYHLIAPSQNSTIPNSAIYGIHLSSNPDTIQYPLNPVEPILQNCPDSEPHVPTLSPSYFICRPVNHRGPLNEDEILQMLRTNPSWLS